MATHGWALNLSHRDTTGLSTRWGGTQGSYKNYKFFLTIRQTVNAASQILILVILVALITQKHAKI